MSGFLTGLYVVATPLLGAAILRRGSRHDLGRRSTWPPSVLAVLSLNGVSTGYGELLTVVSAVVYAGHILALGRFSTPATVLSLSLVQLVVITLICGLLAVLPISGPGCSCRQPGGLAGGGYLGWLPGL